MSSCQKHQQFDSPNTTRSVKSTNALYITVFLPSWNVWSGYNTETVPKQASSLFSSLIVPVKQIQIMKLQMPVLNPHSWWVYPFESGIQTQTRQKWAVNLPCLDYRRSETGQRWVSLPLASVPFQDTRGRKRDREREGERERDRQRGFVASSTGSVIGASIF